MTGLLQCTYQELSSRLVDDEEVRNLMDCLIAETSAVCRAEDARITRDTICKWTISILEKEKDSSTQWSNYSTTVLNMKGGSGPCLEYSSGWIIGRYKLRGIPCPKHEKVAAALEIIVAEVSLDSTITRPSSEPTAPTNGADHKYDEERRYQQRLDRRDKVEVIKDEKAQRQREELGKQPLPEYFVSPNISPLGSKQIGLKREFD